MKRLCPQCLHHNPQTATHCEQCKSPLASFGKKIDDTIVMDTDKPVFKPGDFIADRYLVTSVLGQGGMGVVYRVEDMRLGNQQLALKMIHPDLVANPDARRRFEEEVIICRNLNHPAIIRVYHFEDLGKRYFFIMEYVDGKSLASLLDERKGKVPPFTPLEIKAVMEPLLDGLAYAHQYTIHRDIKPDNIMVSGEFPEVSIKILDFGIARAMSESRFRQSVQIMGTAYYIAPELFKDVKEVQPSVDLYAVGMILYQMLTGELAMGSWPLPSKLIPELPVSLDRIVQKSLSLIPAHRYGRAAELKLDLLAALAETEKGSREIAELLTQAQQAVKAADWVMAAQKLEQILQLDPTHAQARKNLPLVKEKIEAQRREQERQAAQEKLEREQREAAAARAKEERERQARQEAAAKKAAEEQERQRARRERDEAGKSVPPPKSRGVGKKVVTGVVLCAAAWALYVYGPDWWSSPASSRQPAEQAVTLEQPPEPASGPVPVQNVADTKHITPQTGQNWTDPYTGMELVWVEGGCYQMGCGSWTSDCDDDEKPVHEVCVDGFWLGKYEVTQGQWQKVMGTNPSRFKKGDNYPVEQVSWDDTQKFIAKLNSKGSGGYRLPTEAQWEFAARSGGKEEKYAGGNNLNAVAWYTDNSGGSTHPVGTKQANGLKIYDMTGNVWEWCADWGDSGYYVGSPRNNPQGPSTGAFRVSRGGSWYDNARRCRCAYRLRVSTDIRFGALGFRCARVQE